MHLAFLTFSGNSVTSELHRSPLFNHFNLHFSPSLFPSHHIITSRAAQLSTKVHIHLRMSAGERLHIFELARVLCSIVILAKDIAQRYSLIRIKRS